MVGNCKLSFRLFRYSLWVLQQSASHIQLLSHLYCLAWGQARSNAEGSNAVSEANLPSLG
jgi:hypothetical protein